MPVFYSASEEETFEFARGLAESLEPPLCILLFGDLGAGKTTLTRGLAAGFGLDPDDVSSPTFALVHRYAGRTPIHHIDLHRLSSDELDELGLDEILDDPGSVVIVEWADRLGGRAPREAVRLRLDYVDPHTRRIEIEPSAALPQE